MRYKTMSILMILCMICLLASCGRDAYLKSKGGLCEECYRKGKIVPAEEVHHIVFITPDNVNDPNITLNFSNLIALCRECHRRKHGTQKRYDIDEWGRITPR